MSDFGFRPSRKYDTSQIQMRTYILLESPQLPKLLVHLQLLRHFHVPWSLPFPKLLTGTGFQTPSTWKGLHAKLFLMQEYADFTHCHSASTETGNSIADQGTGRESGRSLLEDSRSLATAKRGVHATLFPLVLFETFVSLDSPVQRHTYTGWNISRL